MTQSIPASDADERADALWRNEHNSAAFAPRLSEAEKLQRNKDVVKHLNDALNQQHFEVYAQAFTPDFVNHDGSAATIGSASMIAFYQPLIEAVPDFHSEHEAVLAQFDRVAVRMTFAGTHLGNFRGMAAPTGNALSWSGTTIYRFNEDGKIVESWQDVDNLALFMQLGVIKMPG